VVQQIRTGNGAFGFNAESQAYEDLMAAGIIDPTRVPRTAPENASGIAGPMIATECPVTEAPEKKEKAAAPAPPEDY
jgi:chaperonin GroEL